MNQAKSWEGGKVLVNSCWQSLHLQELQIQTKVKGFLHQAKLWKNDSCLSPLPEPRSLFHTEEPSNVDFPFPFPLHYFSFPWFHLLLPLWFYSFDSVNKSQLFCVCWTCSCTFHHRPRSLEMSHSHCLMPSVSSKTLWNTESKSLSKTLTPELKIPNCTGNIKIVTLSSCRRPQAVNQQICSTTRLWATIDF